MCGFAGFCDTNSRFYTIGRETVRKMTDKILHRGPDSRGEYSDEFFSVGFNRLKIIDLAGGEQPMLSADGRYLICFNGEIYNYKSIRSELEEKRGVKFRTSSDTEVLLYACIAYGKEALAHLRGMYSFVFYDRREKKLFGARDPFGIKPFYYGFFNGTLMFASEIKALFPHPLFKKEFNSEILPYYLQFQYVPTEETAFKGVKRLMPGHFFTYDGKNFSVGKFFHLPKKSDGKFQQYSFFDHKVSRQKEQGSEKSASETLFTALTDSVKLHMESDVPVGAFLSGGVDSGLICALSKPRNAFTIGFDDLDFDERRQAAETAAHIGTKLTSVEIDARDFFSALPEVQYHSDEPYANLSAVPLYLIAKRASSDVKVIISGEGADELFGGYEWYADGALQSLYKKLPSGVRRFAFEHSAPLGKRVKRFTEKNLRGVEDTFIGQAKIMPPSAAYSLLSKEYKALRSCKDITSKYYAEASESSELQKKMYLDQNLWLPFDILNKADKMTMASSVELRVPYLDLKVLAVSGTLSDRLLVRNKTTKYLLRKTATRVLPESAALRPKKGFPVPFRSWIREPQFKEKLRDAFESETARQFFEDKRLIEMLDEHAAGKGNHARVLYTVYTFIVWYDRFFKTPEPASLIIDDVKEANEQIKISADSARL